MFQELKLLLKQVLLYVLSLNCWLLTAQGDFFMRDDVSEKIHFELISNLIIIPLEVNDVVLSFVLDTGVSKAILFNLSERDSLSLKNTKTFYLHGLGGGGRIEALKSSYNRLKLGDAVGVNQDLYLIFDKTINFTPRLGVTVHGIIGYNIFDDFVVEINYHSKYIKLHKPNSFKPKTSKKWKTIPIDIHGMKPYIYAEVTIEEIENTVKLLIDTGSSDAFWLFENIEVGLTPKKDLIFDDYLGKGLSGSVYGKRSKVKNLVVGDFDLENVNVAFPDSLSIDVAKIYRDRNGSLGGDVLKRFNLFFDYTNKKLYLKKSRFFSAPFRYNNSGIVLEHYGTLIVNKEIEADPSGITFNRKKYNYTYNSIQIDSSMNSVKSLKPAYKIVELRKSSNAYASGLREGDILININGKPAYNYKLHEINKILYGKTGSTMRLKISRYGITRPFKFKLDDAFKINEPSN